MRKITQQFFKDIFAEINSGEPLLVGKALTKAFGLAIFFLAILPQHTSDGGWQIRVWAFVLSPPNEIGDTFAGLAGVLAFLWIIVTVWLQSQALNEQRDELELTRKEFEAQRIATQAMADAMISQGKIFEEEQKQRTQGEAREYLDELLLTLDYKWCHMPFQNWRYSQKNGDGSLSLCDINIGSEYVSGGTSIDIRILSIVDCLTFTLANLFLIEKNQFMNLPKSSSGLELLMPLFKEIEGVEMSLSFAQKERFSRLGIANAVPTLRTIIDGDFWSTEEQTQ